MRLFKNIKAILATKEGKLKVIILLSGFLLITLVIGIGALQLTSTPQFCQSCHEMRPEYVTWKASSHSQISCVDCHISPGTGNLLRHKIESFKELYDHFSGQVYAPITVNEPIKDEVCERCHTSNRVATPSGDIKIPHKVHSENKVPCVKCHQAVAHANIGEEGFTADGNWDKWIEPVGKVYMRSDFRKFSMQECLKCHKEAGAGPKPDNCEACHYKLIKPESHKSASFTTEHGIMAQQDIKQCDKCHKLTEGSKATQAYSESLIVQYVRNNEFCSNCHINKKPPSHQADWKKAHAVSATENKEGCLVCHDEGRPSKKSMGTKTYCYLCHVSQLHDNLQSHSRYPLGSKPTLTRNPCFSCHPEKGCTKCHYVPG